MILITKSLAPGVLKGKLGDFPGGPEVVISPCIARRGVGGVFPRKRCLLFGYVRHAHGLPRNRDRIALT